MKVKKRGITLIEIIVTIAIIGILLAILIPAVVGYHEHHPKHTTAYIQLSENETVEVEVDHYYEEDGVLTIRTVDGGKYVVHSSKVVLQIERN